MDQEDFEEMASIGELPANNLHVVVIRPAEGSPFAGEQFFYDNDTGAIHVGAHNDNIGADNDDSCHPSFFHDPYNTDHEADC